MDTPDAQSAGTGLASMPRQLWEWLGSPRTAPGWQAGVAMVLLSAAALVHLDLFLRTMGVQPGLNIALGVNLSAFVLAVVLISAQAGQSGWLLGAGAAAGAATAWTGTELFPQLSFMDPEGQSRTGNPVLQVLTVHLPDTGNLCFGAEIIYLLLWAVATRDAPPPVEMLRRGVVALCVLLIGGFVIVLVLGGGAGERYSHTG